MRKLKKLAVWAVVIAMVVSLLPGMTFIKAKADPVTPTLSETYKEATDLLTNGGYMNNSTKAWTDLITVDEINSLIDTLLYNSLAQYNWPHPLYEAGDTVSGASLIEKGLSYIGYSGDIWIEFFHLTRGLVDYNPSAALTREQAAQILLNLLRANPSYNSSALKANDTLLGLTYEKTTDSAGRPYWQWYQNGNPITAKYSTPLAVVEGGSSWAQIFAAAGYNQDVANARGAALTYTHQHQHLRTIVDGVTSDYSLRYFGDGVMEQTWGGYGWEIEVFDSFYLVADGTFTSRGMDAFAGRNFLGEVRKDTAVAMYGNADGSAYGWWNDQFALAAIAGLDDGFYLLQYCNGITMMKPATVISATLDEANLAANTVTTSGVARYCADAFLHGRALAVPENVGNTYTFYLDNFGRVIAMKACAHPALSEWKDNGDGRHVAHCTTCYLEKFEACVAGPWQSADDQTHVKKCGSCQAVMESASHNMGNWTYVDENNCKKVCSDNCGYEPVQEHDTEVRDAETSSQINPGYTGDTWCKNCETKLATGQDIPKVDHDHIPGTPVQENVVEAKCEQPGSYTEVVYCTFTNCGQPLSSTPKTIDPLQHIPGTPVKENIEPAKCESKGGYDEVTYCTRPECGEELGSVHKDVDPLNHSWSETGRVPATATSNGSVTETCNNDPLHVRTTVLPAELEGNTSFLEAAELALALGMTDTTKATWTENLTGAEANKMLQALYDGPGFVAEWHPDFAVDATVTGKDFAADVLVTIGWNYADTDLWINYNHLYKGLGSDFNASAAMSREQACQIVLNAMKAIPVYNTATIKANDPLYGLTLVKVSEDDAGRPTYKWVKGSVDVTKAYADTPVAVVRGGSTWNQILGAIGYVTTDGVVPAVFRWTENGTDFSDPVNKVVVPDDSSALLTSDYKLEIYTDYSTDRTGFEYIIVCTIDEDSSGGPEIPGPGGSASVPAVPQGITYKQAVQLMIALGWLAEDADMDGNLTGAEANKILQALYDGPGFVAEWHPDFADNATVTGKDLASDILVTTGWNYNNDALFTKYNHLEKGMKSDYNSSKAITREQAAQMVLNALKSIPTYNSKSFKYLDGNIGLTHVLVKRDEMGRPYYKWQKNGVDISDVYRDEPVVAMQGGVVWSDILSAVGDVGDINIAQMFRSIEEGGTPSDFVSRKHPDYNLFMDADYALEVYLDYTNAGTFDTYAYTVVVYEGTVNIPATGDNSVPVLMGLLCLGAVAAAAYVVYVAQKRKQHA